MLDRRGGAVENPAHQGPLTAAELFRPGGIMPDEWCRRCAGVLLADIPCRGVVVQVEIDLGDEPVWVGAVGASVCEPLPLGPSDEGLGERGDWITDAAWARSVYRLTRERTGLGEFVRGVWRLQRDRVVLQADLPAVGADPGRAGAIMGALGWLRPWVIAAAWHGVIRPRRARQEILERLPRAARAVVPMLVDGCTEQQIAEALGRSVHTVHDHVKAIYLCLGVRNRMELLKRWMEPWTGW